jgi:hypothetical protein
MVSGDDQARLFWKPCDSAFGAAVRVHEEMCPLSLCCSLESFSGGLW